MRPFRCSSFYFLWCLTLILLSSFTILSPLSAQTSSEEKGAKTADVTPSEEKSGKTDKPAENTQSAPATEATPAQAEPTPTPSQNPPFPGLRPEVQRSVDDFFAQLITGNIDNAYAILTRGSVLVERPNDLELLKRMTKEAVDRFGKISGYEIVEISNVGTRLVMVTSISLGSKFPLRWKMYYYSAVPGTWRLIDIRVDDRLTVLFGEQPSPTGN